MANEENPRIRLYRELIREAESALSRPNISDWEVRDLNERIRRCQYRIREIEEREASRWWGWARRPAEEVTGKLAGKAVEKVGAAGEAAFEKAKRAQEWVDDRYKKSWLSADVGELVKDSKYYRQARWKAKGAKVWAKDKALTVDDWSKTYFPTFRKAARGGGRLVKGTAGVATSGVKRVGGFVRDKGTNLVTIGLKGAVQPVYVGFWLFLTLALQLIDLFWLNFGGVDYKVLISAIQSGGLELVLRIVLPLYVVIALVILLALKYAESRRIGVFLLVIFVPLIIINRYAMNYKILGVSLPIISLIVSVVILIGMLEGEERYGFLSWVLLALILSTIFSSGGLYSGFHHLFVAGLIWMFLLKHPDEKDWTRANYWISILLFIDFFGYGLWQSFGPMQGYTFMQSDTLISNRFVFPLWFLFVVFYTAGQENYRASGFDKFIMAAVILFYIIALVDGVYGWANIRAQIQENPEQAIAAKNFYQDAWNKLKAFPKKIIEEYDRGMEYATGGYYQGKVEENEDPRNELGVHIEELQAADKEFYENEQVVLWGDLKAKTLDKPIYVYMSCESDGIKGIIKPTTSYKIERFEEIPFECRFNGGELKAGTNNIEVKVEFNFETLGYLKTYFMDIERMRALRKENVDPLRQYGIDKKPEARYTNGPVKLGMGTVDPPVGLSTTVDGYSYIGVMVQPQWYGKIKNITDLTIQVPKDLEVEKIDDLYCRQEFEMVEEGSEGYSIYKMTKDTIKKIKTPIGDYKSWRCSIRIPIADVPAILGNTPVATYYYRANVSYIYEIEKSTSVYIKSVIGEQRILLDCKTVCDDSDGCVCTITGCCIPQGESIRIGYTCDNDPSPSNACRGYDRTISDIDYAIRYIDGLLAINELCARGLTDDAKRELDASNLNQSEKDSIRGLLEGCSSETTKINYIEFGEDKIVKKVQETVTMFQTTKNTLLQLTDENKRTLNSKKEEFIGEIDEVIGKFGQIKTVYNLNIQDTQRLTILEGEKVKLQGWAY